jgi:hypothetical protein
MAARSSYGRPRRRNSRSIELGGSLKTATRFATPRCTKSAASSVPAPSASMATTIMSANFTEVSSTTSSRPADRRTYPLLPGIHPAKMINNRTAPINQYHRLVRNRDRPPDAVERSALISRELAVKGTLIRRNDLRLLAPLFHASSSRHASRAVKSWNIVAGQNLPLPANSQCLSTS